jgi:hypothetical protein
MAEKTIENDGKESAVKFESKWLKGLVYRTSEKKKARGKDGQDEIRRVAVERPLSEAEVLGWKITGNEVVIVSRDGRKYRVKR